MCLFSFCIFTNRVKVWPVPPILVFSDFALLLFMLSEVATSQRDSSSVPISCSVWSCALLGCLWFPFHPLLERFPLLPRVHRHIVFCSLINDTNLMHGLFCIWALLVPLHNKRFPQVWNSAFMDVCPLCDNLVQI